MSIRTGVGTTSTIRVIVLLSGEGLSSLDVCLRVLRGRVSCVVVLGVGAAAAVASVAAGATPTGALRGVLPWPVSDARRPAWDI
jgi:hypothetical protein